MFFIQKKDGITVCHINEYKRFSAVFMSSWYAYFDYGSEKCMAIDMYGAPQKEAQKNFKKAVC